MLLVALVALVVAAALPTSAVPLPPTEAKLVAANSTSLSFSIGIPAGTDATTLHVLVQTVRDGNATDNYFPLTLPGPIIVDVGNLRPGSEYVFAFYLESPTNGTSEATKPSPSVVRTHNLGPQIVSFFASDPTEDTVNPTADADFSVGDTITLAFSAKTNAPAVGNKAEIDALFSFSQQIGAAYTGKWVDASLLVITVQDVGQSSPPLGGMFVSVIGNLVQPDGKSDVSRSVSPPLIGSWSHSASTKRYFVPLDATTNLPVTNPDDFSAYNVNSEMNVPRRIPLALIWPSDARAKGYGINAGVEYPSTLDSSFFMLQGKNFTTSPQSRETSRPEAGKPEVPFTNAELAKALAGLELAPKAGFVGFVCIRLTLVDRTQGAGIPVSTVYTNIHFTAPAQPDIPSLTVNGESGGLLSNPMGTIKTYQTPLIIALCSVVGFFILLGLGICLYKKYRGGKDARDFEGQPLSSEEPQERALGGEGGATRRFYYDAKV